MQLVNTIWNAMGWCPMHAAPGFLSQESGKRMQRPEQDDGGGPVKRRFAGYMRLAWGIFILSWVVAILVLPYLPEMVPIHWGLHGQPDAFASRFVGAFLPPIMITLVMALLIVIPRFDSLQGTLEAVRDSYAILICATLAMLFGIEVMALVVALGTPLPIGTIISVLFGLLFIVMGNLMPHIGRNRAMGIRLPWTLASDEIWKRTHERAEPVFVAGGILIILGGLTGGIWALALMLAVIAVTILYITIWSYRLAHRLSPQTKE